MMKNANSYENLNTDKKVEKQSSGIKNKAEEALLKDVKKDVDEFDLSSEYFSNENAKSDGEDF